MAMISDVDGGNMYAEKKKKIENRILWNANTPVNLVRY